MDTIVAPNSASLLNKAKKLLGAIERHNRGEHILDSEELLRLRGEYATLRQQHIDLHKDDDVPPLPKLTELFKG